MIDVWGEVVLPLGAGYLVVIVALAGAARGRGRGEPRRSVPAAVRGLLGTLVGGTALFLAAVGAWCATVDHDPSSCFREALHEGTFLVFGFALPVLVLMIVVAGRRSR